jgi:hypothetical protein
MNRTRRLGFALTLSLIGLWAAWPRPVQAEHFDIVLKVTCGDRQAQTFMDTTPPIGGLNRRPVVTAKSGDEVRVMWKMKSGFPHGTMKGVTIHFFVVREAQAGQKPVPDPAGEAGIVDNSFVMDFAPQAEATGALRFRAPAAGDYLIRVQSENTHQEHGHEHFSAIDLHVD